MEQIEASYIEHHHMLLRVLVALAVASLAWLPGFGQATMSWAHEGVTVRPDPLSLEIGVGNTGVVNILVEDVTDLNCVQFDITFDPTLVEVVDADPVKPGVQIQPGDFLSPDWVLDNTVDNDNGTIAYALCQLGGSASGSGCLAIITWHGKAEGTSPVHFTYVLLSALGGVPIDTSTQDGRITVGAALKVYLPIIYRTAIYKSKSLANSPIMRRKQ